MAQAQLPQWLVGHIMNRDLCTALMSVHWCQQHKLLAERKICPKCGQEMHLVKRKAVNKEQMGWQEKVVGRKWACVPGLFMKLHFYEGTFIKKLCSFKIKPMWQIIQVIKTFL